MSRLGFVGSVMSVQKNGDLVYEVAVLLDGLQCEGHIHCLSVERPRMRLAENCPYLRSVILPVTAWPLVVSR
jgi:hypothetical protein